MKQNDSLTTSWAQDIQEKSVGKGKQSEPPPTIQKVLICATFFPAPDSIATEFVAWSISSHISVCRV